VSPCHSEAKPKNPGRWLALLSARTLPLRCAQRQGDKRRAIWRTVLGWRSRLFARHRWRRLVLEHVAGRPILVLPDVFNPTLFRSSEFLVEQLANGTIPNDAHVLDMGTGSGVAAIAAARRARRVVAVDVNPAAVRCARINALLNHVEDRIEVREGDLFASLDDERFDVVLFNPPYFRGVPRDAVDQAWRSTDVVERFAAGLAEHLTPNGQALIVLSSDGERDAFLEAFAANRLAPEVVAERDLINEVLAVYRLRAVGAC
jgi:release factor glutamine methyltransferase